MCQDLEVNPLLPKKEFCCVDNFSVLLPYRDLERLLETANKMQFFQDQLARTNEQLTALRIMYSEALEKIAEINRFL